MKLILQILVCAVFIIAMTDSLELEAIDCKALGKLLKTKSPNNIYFPHEDDCTYFYQCGAGGAAKSPCGEGTIFSIRNKDCRRPEETKCILLDAFLEKKNITLEDFYNEDY